MPEKKPRKLTFVLKNCDRPKQLQGVSTWYTCEKGGGWIHYESFGETSPLRTLVNLYYFLVVKLKSGEILFAAGGKDGIAKKDKEGEHILPLKEYVKTQTLVPWSQWKIKSGNYQVYLRLDGRRGANDAKKSTKVRLN